jgi:hypothetical protein
MGSIPLPALGVQVPQHQANPLEQYANLMQLKQMRDEAPLRQQALQQSVQQGQLQLQQAQQAQKDQEAFRTALMDPQFHGKTMGDIADHLAMNGQITPQGYFQAKKSDLEMRKSLGDMDKTALENLKAGHAATQELYNNVMNMPDDQLAAQWPQIAQQYDAIPGNNKQPLDPSKPLTKQQLAQFGPMLSMQNAYLSGELERKSKAATVAKTEQETKNLAGKTDPNSPLYSPSAEAVAMGTAPGSEKIKAGQAALAGQKAAAEARARQPFEMALNRQRQALTQGDPNAAADLLVNGDATLSELKSRGATPDFIARTLYAARQKSGGKYNPQQAEAEFKVAQSPTNLAFFGSAKSLTDKGGTLDQLAEIGKQIPQSDITALNSIEDWMKAASGNGPLAHYAATALGVADDYSKVMGGGQGSDTSRKQVLDTIKASAGPQARSGALEGIRGAVNSQVNSRIGNNSVLKRMYGGDGTTEAPKPPSSSVSVGSVISQNGHRYKVTAVDKDGKPTAAEPVQ